MINLHCHDEYSYLDGFGSPKKWIETLKSIKQNTIAITNHGNVDSMIKWSKEAKINNIKLIAGCEFYICEDSSIKNKESKTYHITLLAQNKQGWKNILKLLTHGNVIGFYHKPRIDPKILLNNIDGIIVGSACVGTVLTTNWGKELFSTLATQYPNQVYCEIMPHHFEKQYEVNKVVIEFAKKNNIPIVCTNDAHYPNKSDAELQEICLTINQKTTLKDSNRMKMEGSFHLATNKYMIQEFSKHDYIDEDDVLEAIDNTQLIADRCENFYVEPILPQLPLAPLEGIENGEDELFIKLINEGFEKKKHLFTQDEQVYRDRIKEELDVLIPKGFSRYFLIVIELLKWCSDNGLVNGAGRGSVGGCLCAWLTNITKTDPIRFELLFSRFQSPDRTDLPDIDFDVEKDKRELLINHIKNVYGRNRVCQISTLSCMQLKTAMLDTARVYGVDSKYVNGITKSIDNDIDIEEFKKEENKLLFDFYKKYSEIVEIAFKLKGTVRGQGTHAAGVCICSNDLYNGDNCNIVKRGEQYLANWDKDECESMGLMKLDVLGLSTLSRIHNCLDLIKENENITIDVDNIDVEDKDSLNLIAEGFSFGVFQFSSKGIIALSQAVKVDSFADVVAINALYRPGTLRSGMHNEYAERKHGKNYEIVHECLNDILLPTYGIVIYQEQAMLLFNKLAGFSWVECNKVRKVIAKSKGEEALNVYKDKFIDGCKETSNLEYNKSLEIWNTIVSFSEYSFNKSHSVEYSFLAMWDSWLKNNYAGEFYASYCSYEEDYDKIIAMLKEAKKRRVKISLPKINKSDFKYWKFDNKKVELIMPFSALKGFGDSIANHVQEYLDDKGEEGFFGSIKTVKLRPKVKELFDKIHAFDNYNFNKEELKEIDELFLFNVSGVV